MEDKALLRTIDKMKKDIEALEVYVAEKEESCFETEAAKLESFFYHRLLSSPITKVFYFLASSFILVGLAIWGIGSWSNQIHIDSLQNQSDKTLQYIENSKEEIESLEEETTKLFTDKSSKVLQLAKEIEVNSSIANDRISAVNTHSKQATKKINDILSTFEDTYGGKGEQALEELRKHLQNEINKIESEREGINSRARKLQSDIFSDHAEMKENVSKSSKEVKTAIEAFRTLDASAMTAFFSSFVGISFLVLLIAVLITLGLTIFALYKLGKSDKK